MFVPAMEQTCLSRRAPRVVCPWAWPRGRSPARGCTRRFALHCLTVTTSIHFLRFCSFPLSPRGTRTTLRVSPPLWPRGSSEDPVLRTSDKRGAGRDTPRAWAEVPRCQMGVDTGGQPVQAPSGPRDCAHGRGLGTGGSQCSGHDDPEGHVSSVLDSLQQLVPGGHCGQLGVVHRGVLLARQWPPRRIVSGPRVPVGRAGTCVFCRAAICTPEENSGFSLFRKEEGVDHVHAPLLKAKSYSDVTPQFSRNNETGSRMIERTQKP